MNQTSSLVVSVLMLLGFLIFIACLPRDKSKHRAAIKAEKSIVVKKCPKCNKFSYVRSGLCQYCQHNLVHEPPTSLAFVYTDRSGWRCSACGGGLRDDATVCKHCDKSLSGNLTRMYEPKPSYTPSYSSGNTFNSDLEDGSEPYISWGQLVRRDGTERSMTDLEKEDYRNNGRIPWE